MSEKKIGKGFRKIRKQIIKKNGIIKRSLENTEINEDILGMWWEITLNGELVNKINYEGQFQINMMTLAYKPGKYNIKIMAVCKDRKKYQASNEIVYEKLQ